MKALTHKDFRRLGFELVQDEAYRLGNIRIDCYEGKNGIGQDFIITIDDIVYCWVETFEELETIIENNLIKD
jgi:choline kinase